MKKNQLALIFLTLITMLAVWYFKSPSANTGKNEEPTIIVTNTKNQVLANMREELHKQRSERLDELNNIIADENASLVSKTAASLEKDELSALLELEAALEIKVTNLGYQDAFVEQTANGIEVIVISTEATSDAALEIINVINENFDETKNVVVSFMTNDELNKA